MYNQKFKHHLNNFNNKKKDLFEKSEQHVYNKRTIHI